MSPDRLTVRAMPDPVGFVPTAAEQEDESPHTASLSGSPTNVAKQQDSRPQNYKKHCRKLSADNVLNVRATRDGFGGSNSPLISDVSATKKFSSKQEQGSPVSLNILNYKLSPKVFGVVPNCRNNDVIIGMVIESSDDSQDGRNQLAWSSTASQCSDHLDSEVSHLTKFSYPSPVRFSSSSTFLVPSPHCKRRSVVSPVLSQKS